MAKKLRTHTDLQKKSSVSSIHIRWYTTPWNFPPEDTLFSGAYKCGMHTCIHMHTLTHIGTQTGKHMYTHKHTYEHAHIHTHMHSCMATHTQANTCIHMHTFFKSERPDDMSE